MDARAAMFSDLAGALVDAYNRRDPDAWAVLFHEQAHFQPTVLTASSSLYVGRDAVRHFMEELLDDDRGQKTRIKSVRPLGEDQFVMRGEVMIEDQVVTPSTVIFRLKDGLIVDGKAYLTDASTLEQLGLIPDSDD